MVLDTNIAVALIALIGAILSGIFAFIGSMVAARLGKDAQIKTAAQEAFISARLNVYLAFEESFEHWSNTKNRETCAVVYRAENAVRLVASEETISVLSQLTEYIREYETQGKLHPFEEFAVAHTAALRAMRNDLMHYPIPTPESGQKESRIE